MALKLTLTPRVCTTCWISGEPGSGRTWGTTLTGRSKVKDSGWRSWDKKGKGSMRRRHRREG